MRKDVSRNKLYLALKRAIEPKFGEAEWLELGYLTEHVDLIQEHPRLLRSLVWGDPDYPSNVIEVVPKILGESLENLPTVEEFVGLEGWLKENDERLYGDLYGGDVVSLEQIEKAGAISGVAELNRHASRIRQSIRSDPEQSIGSAKELLETVLKTILGEYGRKHSGSSQTSATKARDRCQFGQSP